MEVIKYPIKPAATKNDLAILDAWKIRMAITKARFLNRDSTIPEQKQRQLSNKNVLLAVSVFEKFSNIPLRMIKVIELQA
ncbi:MAG: hypothetical protein LBQ23_00285 [Puniceicoccales bacterium]|jgi:hypothetical protein|nr:hypothetical protein [Puniceicoccales bacterium]